MYNLGAGTRNLVNAIWVYMPAFFTVCLVYTCLMVFQLTIDTVMIVGEQGLAAFLIVVTCFSWAYAIWFTSRLVSLVPENGILPTNQFIKHLPRFFAANCFVALQCAMLALIHVINMSGWFIVLFIFCHGLYFLLLTEAYKRNVLLGAAIGIFNPLKRFWLLAWIIAIIYVLALATLAIINYYKNPDLTHGYILPALCIPLFWLEVIIIYVATNRRFFIDSNRQYSDFIKTAIKKAGAWPIAKLHYRILKKLGLSKRNAAIERVYFMAFNMLFLMSLAYYICCIKSTLIASGPSPLPFTLLALTVLITFFNFTACISRKNNFNYNIIYLLLAIVMGSLHYTHQQVRTVPIEQGTLYRRTVNEYFTNWLEDTVRINDIKNATKDNPYTAYLVLSDGGGARAATWSAMLLSKLDDNSQGKFSKHLISLAGASGGGVGNTAFYGLLECRKKGSIAVNESLYAHAVSFFKGDFFTYTVGRFLGPDFFNYMLPFPLMDDRGAALEQAFEYGDHDRLLAQYFASALDTAYDISGKLPASFINATNVKSGLTNSISNLKLNDSLRTDLLDWICPGKSLRVSTAAILGARFPYISPAGELNERYYVDGGYYDNSGAGTSQIFMKQVYKTLEADTHKYFIKFQVLALHNSSRAHVADAPIHPLINDLLAPILTMIGMEDGTTNAGNEVFTDYMREKSDSTYHPLQFELYSDNEKEEYPMSWTNSNYQLQRIKCRIDTVCLYDPAYKAIMTVLSK